MIIKMRIDPCPIICMALSSLINPVKMGRTEPETTNLVRSYKIWHRSFEDINRALKKNPRESDRFCLATAISRLHYPGFQFILPNIEIHLPASHDMGCGQILPVTIVNCFLTSIPSPAIGKWRGVLPLAARGEPYSWRVVT